MATSLVMQPDPAVFGNGPQWKSVKFVWDYVTDGIAIDSATDTPIAFVVKICAELAAVEFKDGDWIRLPNCSLPAERLHKGGVYYYMQKR